MRYALFCDYGLDDAVATTYILDKREKGDQIDIIAIGGNSEKSVAYRNGKTLLNRYAYFGGDLTGVRFVNTLEVEQPYACLPSIHGADGMGDAFAPLTVDIEEISFSDWLEEEDEVYLCSFGPCTLVVPALEKRKCAGLLIMGGCVHEEPNFNGYEFNHALDRKAFSESVKYPHFVATLDGCRAPEFNAVLHKPSGGELFNLLVDTSLKYATARHADRCFIYDYITARFLFEKELFKVENTVDKDGNRLTEIKIK